jgi:hypothetical protein
MERVRTQKAVHDRRRSRENWLRRGKSRVFTSRKGLYSISGATLALEARRVAGESALSVYCAECGCWMKWMNNSTNNSPLWIVKWEDQKCKRFAWWQKFSFLTFDNRENFCSAFLRDRLAAGLRWIAKTVQRLFTRENLEIQEGFRTRMRKKTMNYKCKFVGLILGGNFRKYLVLNFSFKGWPGKSFSLVNLQA